MIKSAISRFSFSNFDTLAWVRVEMVITLVGWGGTANLDTDQRAFSSWLMYHSMLSWLSE